MFLMLNKSSLTNWFVPGIIILLSGCVTVNSDESVRLAARQVELIRTRLPVQSVDYTWVEAESSGSIIAITVTGHSQRYSPDALRDFVNNFQQRLCISPSVRFLLSKQVEYRIFMKDIMQGASTETVVNNETCNL
ncbi:TPA: type II secretion system pilot lipoprotein GspS-beta [Salmonella enterica subsp. enterica serovar Virchow]